VLRQVRRRAPVICLLVPLLPMVMAIGGMVGSQ
jgi:hypothetical protein